MPTSFIRPLFFLWASLGFYGLAYVALVERGEQWFDCDSSLYPVPTVRTKVAYRGTSPAAKRLSAYLFEPIHDADRHFIRPRYWREPKSELQAELDMLMEADRLRLAAATESAAEDLPEPEPTASIP